jgi:hypothetical protein
MHLCAKTPIISLCNIEWLVFITVTESVYCAVRTGYLNTIQFKLLFKLLVVQSLGMQTGVKF